MWTSNKTLSSWVCRLKILRASHASPHLWFCMTMSCQGSQFEQKASSLGLLMPGFFQNLSFFRREAVKNWPCTSEPCMGETVIGGCLEKQRLKLIPIRCLGVLQTRVTGTFWHSGLLTRQTHWNSSRKHFRSPDYQHSPGCYHRSSRGRKRASSPYFAGQEDSACCLCYVFLRTGIHPPLPCCQLQQSDSVYQTQNDEVVISNTYLNQATNARALCEPLDDFDLSFSPRSLSSGLDTLIIYHRRLPLTLLPTWKKESKRDWERGPNLDSTSAIDESLWKPYLVFLAVKLRICFTEAVYVSNQSRSGNVADSTGLP